MVNGALLPRRRIGLGHCPTIALSCAIAALHGAATAQTRPQGQDLEEVVVTATRSGEERLQDVPMSISALSPDELSAKGLTAMGDFLRTVPGVVLNAEEVGINRIAMRGLVTSDLDSTNLQDRSAVALYLDEIPIGLNMGNPDLRVMDMERVEIIRGPQGTLYGAGSMAGTVRYITKKPDPAHFAGVVDTALSSTDGGGTNWNVKGAVNLPVVADRMAVRLGAYHEEQSGYVDNLGTGEDDANSLDNTQANVALRWLASDALTVDASFTYQKLESDGTNGVYREVDDSYVSSTPVGLDDDLKIYNLTLGYDADAFDVVSSTSYVDREFNLITSFDFLNEYFIGVPLVSPSSQLSTIENFTQEIRIVSKPARFSWQVGAYYGDDKRRYVQNTFAEGLDALIGVSSLDLYAPYPDEIYFGDIHVEDKQWAVFGEATFELTAKVSVTAGLRYFDFEGPASYFQGAIAGTDAQGLPVAQDATEKASGFNPKLLVSYKPTDDLMLFAEAARGFRYGGVNYPVPDSFCAESLAEDGLTSAPLTFGPDQVWSYSIGEKATLMDRRVVLNTTAFLNNWSDAQTVHPLDCAYPFTENGGEIQSSGIEFEGLFKLLDGFVIGLNATYTNSESDGGIAAIDARDGDKVPFFPEWLAALSADYRLALASGEVAFAADYSYRGTMGTDFNPNRDNYRKIPSSGVVNASVNYYRGPWQVGLFATNLTNSEQVSSIVPQPYPTYPGDQRFIGRPRTVGLRLQHNF